MAVLVQFDTAVADSDGQSYIARVCGRQMADNMWEGWIEFDPHGGGPAVRTRRETTQPNLPDLEYWASGLTATYLEGALDRALHPEPEPARRPAARDSAHKRPGDSRR